MPIKSPPTRQRTAPPGRTVRQSSVRGDLRPRWIMALMVALPLVCVLLGGGTERWSQAVVLLGLGTLLLAAPPCESLGKGINLIFLSLLALACTAFLPARWLPWPAWRSALTDDLSAILPATYSPQPWTSAEGLVLLTAGLCWVYRMATVRWTAAERRRVGAWFAGGVAALAALFLILFKLGVTVSIWPSARGFGPFPNRNQTADFLAVGALPVLACAHAAWRAERREATIGWVCAWLVVAGAVFNSFSRGGVIILFGGTAFYLGMELLRSWRKARVPAPDVHGSVMSWRKLAIVASLGLVLLGIFFLFGEETLGRFRPGTKMMEHNAASDALRLRIQADAVHMIAAAPWCGTGLDNFDDVFANFRRLSVAPIRVLHPESDWLWLTAELGWPALALALAACVLLVRRLDLPKHGAERPLRTAAALGLAAFAAHGLAEVSAHRLGTALSALFLLGLAMPGPGDSVSPEHEGLPIGGRGRWPVIVFRGMGALFLVAGGLWLLEARGTILLPGAQGVARLKTETRQLGDAHEYQAAQAAATRALAWAPLDWTLYDLRGGTGVFLRRDLEGTLADFRRARYLEPWYDDLPFNEAQLWANVGQSPQAVSALMEACRRAPDRADFFLSATYEAAADKADFFDWLNTAIRHHPAWQIALLERLFPPESTRLVQTVLAVDPELRQMDDRLKRRFLRAWCERTDGTGLAAGIAAHPAWQPPGWRWWAEAQAREGTVEAQKAACAIVARFVAPPVVPATPKSADAQAIEDLKRRAVSSPGDPAIALSLYESQKAAGDKDGALGTLKRITGQPECPAYFFGLQAQLAATAGDWKTGWEAWHQYFKGTGIGK